MLARPPIVGLVAVTLVTLPTGCNPCGNTPFLSDDKCPAAATESFPSTTDASSSGDASTSTSPSTTDVTTTDGPTTGTDGSTSDPSTTGGACGDGTIDPGEQCDDGNQTPADGCEPDCLNTPPPSCGDGKVDPDEECDDANDLTNDGCIACTAATCGDGFVNEGAEQCDEGPLNGMYDHCADDCAGPGPRCGDGAVNGPEGCDDANDADDDDCSNECVAPRLIFVTTTTFTGGALGGLSGADNLCKAVAAAPLNKPTWRAWLSDGTTAAADRLDDNFTGYYKRTDGAIIAKGWADLVDGALENPISITEFEQMVPFPPNVWTNTVDAGEIAGTDHCNNWTTLMGKGRWGSAEAKDPTWTDGGTDNCTNAFHIYCVEE
jgi:cysteine-rich repeat protein